MIKFKTPAEIELMREGGHLLAEIMEKIKAEVRPGMTTLELDTFADKLISEKGEPWFKHVGDYKWATCLGPNEVVVHGIPNNYKLKEGDILGIDIGLLYKGYNSDMSWTVKLPGPKGQVSDDEKDIFLAIGEEALKKAIDQARVGNRIGHISKAIGETIRAGGYSPVRSLVGHGIGRDPHEDPHIPCLLQEPIEKTPKLKEGMTLAIEVIYNQGGPQLVRDSDGWTIRTLDGQLSGLFEKTIAVLKDGPEILTTVD